MRYFKLKDLDVKGKRVLVRVDFNVPLDKYNDVGDDKKIKAALPTIKYLIKNKAEVILMSHLGRPDGKVVEELRLDKIGKRLGRLLKCKVLKMYDCVGAGIERQTNEIMEGEVMLLENLRFYKQEEANERNFSSNLSDLGDLYVNDAFASCHRAHASVVGVTKYMKSAAGFLVEKELEMLNRLKKPSKPFVAVLGGAKVSDKIGVIKNLLKKVDRLLIGGAMMFTFLKAKGLDVGDSLVENDKLSLAKRLLESKKIVLPVDCIVGNGYTEDSKSKNVKIDKIGRRWIGLDIGKETVKEYSNLIAKAKTVFWNGPMGRFEWKQYSNGSYSIARALAKCKGLTIVGGGETGEIIHKLKLSKLITHVSTGGGASLEFLEGKTLPGIKALENSYKKSKKSLA